MESKYLVEEYMLLANILIAEHLHHYCKDKTLLRVHSDVKEDKKNTLKQFYEKVGLPDLDLSSSKAFTSALEKLKSDGDEIKFNAVMRKFLTCLSPAKYACINGASSDDYMHYGLNFPLYTHFTSPIRRYADLLVHRLVTLTLNHRDKTREIIDLMDYSKYAE